MKRTYFILIAITFNFILSTFTCTAQWQHFNFPGLKIYNTNSKYMYSIYTDSTYFLRTTDDWQHWDTIQTGFPIYKFAADSTGQVLVAEKTGNNTYKIFLLQNQSSFHLIYDDTVYLYNLCIHRNYIYILGLPYYSYMSINSGNDFVSFSPSYIANYTAIRLKVICDSIIYAYYFSMYAPYEEEYASFDAGNTWYWVSYFDATTGPLIYVSPYIFLGEDYIRKSTDGGHTFDTCSAALNVKSFAYGNGVLLAGTSTLGIYATTNKGDTWVAFNDGLDSLCCNAYVAVTDSFYYVTLNDSITYRRSIHDLTGISSLAEELPLQLYPNPATDYFTIKSGNYRPFTYQIINMQGSLQKQGNISGSQTEINVADLPRGMYILKVVTEKQTVTKKVLLQ